MESSSAPSGATHSVSAAAEGRPPAITLDQEARDLQLAASKAASRQKIAEAETAILKARKEAITASYPSVDTEPLGGEITVGANVGMVAERVAYALIDRHARTIATAVASSLSEKSRVLIVEDRDLLASDWPYELISTQLGIYRSALEKAREAVREATPEPGDMEPAMTPDVLESLLADIESGTGVAFAMQPHVAGAGMAAAKQLVGAVADISAFFRSDYAVSAKDFDIGTTPLVAEVAGQLARFGYQVAVDRFACLPRTDVMNDFKAALDARQELKRTSAVLKARFVDPATREVTALRSQVELNVNARDAEKDTARRAELEEENVELEGRIADAETKAGPAAGAVASAEALITSFDALITAYTASPDDGGLPPLALAALREQLHGGSAAYTHVLFLGADASAGETISKRSLWPWWNQLTFLGGVQLSHLLVELDSGNVASADSQSLLGKLRIKLSTGEAKPVGPVEVQGDSPALWSGTDQDLATDP